MDVRHGLCSRASEWMLAFIMFNCGWLLLLPSHTFSAPAYSELARQMLSEDGWGWLCLVGGSGRLLVLAMNGALIYRSPHVRAVLAALSSFVWYQLLVGVLATRPVSLLLAFLIAALAFEAINVYRAAGDAAHLDRGAGGGRT